MVDVATLTIAVDSRQLGTATTAQDRFTQSGQRAERQSQRFSQAQQQTARSSRVGARGVQNLGFQLQDIVVQYESGTDAARIFAQQVPQILGGFGALATLLGVGAASLGAFFPQLFEFANAADDASDAVGDLADAIDDYRQALDSGRSSSRELAEDFGRQTGQARELFQIQTELLQLQAQRQASGVFRQIAEQISDAAAAPTDNLIQDLERIVEINQEIDQLTAQQPLFGQNPVISSGIERLQNELVRLSDATQIVRDIESQFNLARPAAIRLAEAIAEARSAEGFEAQAEAFQRLQQELTNALGPFSELDEESQKLIMNLVNARLEATRLSSATDIVLDTAMDLSGVIAGIDFSNAISGANILITRISQAAQGAAAVVGAVGSAVARGVTEQQRLDVQNLELELRRSGATAAQIGGQTAGLRERQRLENQVASGVLIPQAVIEQLVQNAEDRGAEFAANQAALADIRRTQRSGGAGSHRELNRLRREATQLTEDLRTAEEAYADELERVNSLFAAGLISQETFNRATQELTDTYDQFGFTVNDVRDSLADTFTDIITGSENARDAIANLAGEFGRLLLNDTFRRIISGEGFGGGGGFGGFISSILGFANGGAFQGGKVTAFADGGIVSSPTFFPMQGGTGLMGEAGAEAIIPLRRGAGGRLGVDAQQVQLSIVVDAEPGPLFVPTVRAEATNAAVTVSQQTVRQQQRGLPQAIQSAQQRSGI